MNSVSSIRIVAPARKACNCLYLWSLRVLLPILSLRILEFLPEMEKEREVVE